jgi:hypothetical protein
MLLFVGAWGDDDGKKAKLQQLVEQATGCQSSVPNHATWQAAGRAYDELVRNCENSSSYLTLAETGNIWG